MTKFIDADKLKEKKIYSQERHEYIVTVAEIDWQPTADVEEIHHGEWVYCGSDVRRCSYCGHEVTEAQADLYKGCPICRAKMDRKGDDNA